MMPTSVTRRVHNNVDDGRFQRQRRTDWFRIGLNEEEKEKHDERRTSKEDQNACVFERFIEGKKSQYEKRFRFVIDPKSRNEREKEGGWELKKTNSWFVLAATNDENVVKKMGEASSWLSLGGLEEPRSSKEIPVHPVEKSETFCPWTMIRFYHLTGAKSQMKESLRVLFGKRAEGTLPPTSSNAVDKGGILSQQQQHDMVRGKRSTLSNRNKNKDEEAVFTVLQSQLEASKKTKEMSDHRDDADFSDNYLSASNRKDMTPPRKTIWERLNDHEVDGGMSPFSRTLMTSFLSSAATAVAGSTLPASRSEAFSSPLISPPSTSSTALSESYSVPPLPPPGRINDDVDTTTTTTTALLQIPVTLTTAVADQLVLPYTSLLRPSAVFSMLGIPYNIEEIDHQNFVIGVGPDDVVVPRASSPPTMLDLDEYDEIFVVVDDCNAPTTCPICLSDIEDGEHVTRLPCSCRLPFHRACIERWLEDRDTCPTCRARFE
eukprot:g5504.t1